ncbi:hypothetical protein [Alkalihalobacillus sp. BA299]|uniref:hypothetical protein n=1 Tax=Alkalihalobacillus sp. BA299 TaxID=2815938 RepID=UPI001AD9F723|nr:hypothetical protein [Alkalihalobacillus sp. BA299]
MKNSVPIQFIEFWRGNGALPQKKEHINDTEELGKEWQQLLEAIQDAAKKEWEPS